MVPLAVTFCNHESRSQIGCLYHLKGVIFKNLAGISWDISWLVIYPVIYIYIYPIIFYIDWLHQCLERLFPMTRMLASDHVGVNPKWWDDDLHWRPPEMVQAEAKNHWKWSDDHPRVVIFASKTWHFLNSRYPLVMTNSSPWLSHGP